MDRMGTTLLLSLWSAGIANLAGAWRLKRQQLV